MTIQDILNQEIADLQNNLGIPFDQELTQAETNDVTDQTATTVDSLNPDREYPIVKIR